MITLKTLSLSLMAALVLTACSSSTQPETSPAPVESETAPKEAINDAAMEAGGDAMEQESAGAAATYTLAEVAEHSTDDDCWIALSGKVYDVSAFIASGNHGGGDAILEGCGIDATELYETRPMGSGTPHSETARSFLPNFIIGELAN